MILLFGKNGQLGSHLQAYLSNYNLQVVDYPDIDFNKPTPLIKLIDNLKPKLIINAVAYTAVDKAEEDIQTANNVNGHTVGLIAEKAKEIKAGFIHYSTNYIFNGGKSDLYKEDDSPHPINVYGESKLLGEQATTKADGSYLIFRLSWVYTTTHPSFVTKVLNWSRTNETLKIVDDEIGNPTWAKMVARKTAEIVKSFEHNWYQKFAPLAGIYHLANQGAVSRYDLAKEVLALDPNANEQVTKEILPAKLSDFPSPAKRPLYSGLDCSKFENTFEIDLPDWQTSLHEAMTELHHK